MSLVSQEPESAQKSGPDHSAVRKQLTRLLTNPYFSHSKRFPTFLRFVVEHTLAGETEKIKERTLGIEIFGRDPDYDTAADPIVRVTAAEIRKRVAQYYQGPEHREELRITLPSGSYIPKFHWPQDGNDGVLAEEDPAESESLERLRSASKEASLHTTAGAPAQTAKPGAAPKAAHHSLLVLALTCISAAVLSVGAVLIWQASHRSALDFFWQPVLTANSPILVCIADQMQYSSISLRDAAEPTRQVLLKDNLTAVIIDDLNATVKVAGILQSSGKPYTFKGEGLTTLADLRNQPTVFVGAFDNAWTLRLTRPLRYHFANDAEMTHLWVVDGAAPSAPPRWVVNRAEQMATNNYRDYAIVARFTDSNTGQLTVIVAGIARGGTIAAGEFLSDNNDMAQLKRAALAAGNKKNMEVVVSTQIIDGQPGSPTMEAAYFW